MHKTSSLWLQLKSQLSSYLEKSQLSLNQVHSIKSLSTVSKVLFLLGVVCNVQRLPLSSAHFHVAVIGAATVLLSVHGVQHREILQGKRPPRYSIYRSTQSGLTDRIMSGMSTFLHALLTDRAWLYDW